MPKFGYSAEIEEPAARALGKERRISPKQAMEVCRAIRGMSLNEAKEYLEAVQQKKKVVPILRHRKKVAHRGSKGSGQYPVKVAREILKVLKNAEANAIYKGMDVEKLKVFHVSAYKGFSLPGFIPRAFGRSSPAASPLTNIEIILKE
ncbi:MAG: 50S ribosomal protein L22 [Candidatus Hadarchaeaceae archaeon]